MKIVLLQDVKKLGKRGDIVEVADGYGRNVLIRRGLGVEGNKANINTATQRQEAKPKRNKRSAYLRSSRIKRKSRQTKAGF